MRPLALLVMAGTLAAGCAPAPDPAPPPAPQAAPAPNTLTAQEQADGWQLLFDGKTFAGWRGLGRTDVPAGHWTVEDGTLRKIASGNVPTAADGQPMEGGDLMTEATFENFELTLEWKISAAGNSGIKYNVSEALSTAFPPPNAALGFEFQILDDAGHPDAQNGANRTAGALYDMIPPTPDKVLKPVGQYNQARLVFNGGHGEHWLNGVMVVAYDLGTARFDSLLAASKYATIPGFADRRTGHIVLQDHSDDVWYRSLKIRTLP